MILFRTRRGGGRRRESGGCLTVDPGDLLQLLSHRCARNHQLFPQSSDVCTVPLPSVVVFFLKQIWIENRSFIPITGLMHSGQFCARSWDMGPDLNPRGTISLTGSELDLVS